MTKEEKKEGYVRWGIAAMLFVLTSINYADRAAFSLAGPAVAKELGMNAVDMGYVFSAFGWAYGTAQLPGGWLLDRFGSKKIYFWSIFFWSLFTLLQGFASWLGTGAAVAALFILRFLVGAAEAPAWPANMRIVAAWFPAAERGTATAICNAAQYFATILFGPLMGWIIYSFGWKYVFFVMGLLGIAFAFFFRKVVASPKEHPRVKQEELSYIEQGGALVNLDQPARENKAQRLPTWWCVKQLLGNRMLLGIYIGKYCITAITGFFLTWFPVYLVQARGMSILKAGFVAVLPALFGFIGGVLGGVFSDYLLRKGCSLSVARKTPIIGGMLLSTAMIACNYTDVEWLMVAIMALAFFGKGVGSLGWAVLSDASPKEIVGLSGGVSNMFGSAAGIASPIIIGYIIHGTGSFNNALLFVAANAIGAILCYSFVVGEIKRVELKLPACETRPAVCGRQGIKKHEG